jgi:surface carbohydrate biosynthesis protein (TIGR04326 family)
MNVSVVVWDQKEGPTKGIGQVLSWNSYLDGPAVISVPRYVDDNGERMRAKYLAFVHDLGQSRIDGKRVVDHLDIGDGFSFWWMSQLAEKSTYKSPRIYDCLRLMALEEILIDRRPSDLSLVSSDKGLAESMRSLCRKLNIGFRWRSQDRVWARWSLRNVYRALPYPVQGLISLWHLATRWPLRQLRKPQWFSGNRTICLFSYFIHLDSASCAEGIFHSRQWGPLTTYFGESARPTNWVHHFLSSRTVPDARTGLRWLRLFNRDAARQGQHAFLDTFLSRTVVLRAIRQWCRLNIAALRLRRVQSVFYPNASAVWLWPMLRDDWLTSLTGPVAVMNCLWVELFDAALADLPHQSTGMYLCENQGWERALIHAWRRHGHGDIIGVPHATVPFWHLYYFDDRRTLRSRGANAMPLPDRLAVNGPAARNAFADQGYGSDQLVDVEALMYLNLARLAPQPAPDSATRRGSVPLVSKAPPATVLVVGDMLAAAMHRLLRLLEDTITLLPLDYRFTLKAHPGYRVQLEHYPGLHVEETTEPLDQILKEYDFVIAANTTSAAVDAYQSGLPVIVQVDGSHLNMSPLRGHDDVCFVSTPEELAAALQARTQRSAGASEHDEFFFLDPELPRWKQLLSSAVSG